MSSFKKSSLYVRSLRWECRKAFIWNKEENNEMHLCIEPWMGVAHKEDWRAFYELSWTHPCLFLCCLLESVLSSSLNPVLFQSGHQEKHLMEAAGENKPAPKRHSLPVNELLMSGHPHLNDKNLWGNISRWIKGRFSYFSHSTNADPKDNCSKAFRVLTDM